MARPPAVLLIDDDVSLLEMIKLMAERSREVTINTAQSAKEALGTLAEKCFDVIIVDYDMPDIDGIEFLKILRRHGDTTPIIVFTGRGGEHMAIEALNNGANFLLKKGEDPRHQFRDLLNMVRMALERNSQGRSPETTQRIIADMINFSSDPGFAIDRDRKIIAWNDSMEQLTSIPASAMLGKGDDVYSEPFFRTRKALLVNLVFESDDEIRRQKYMIVSRISKGPVIAVTRGQKRDGTEWTLWMKAMPVYDGVGQFVASVGTVRDVTMTFSDVVVHDTEPDDSAAVVDTAPSGHKKTKGGLFDKILGKAAIHYRKGLDLYVKEQKYKEAVEEFDMAIEADENLAHVWNDRGSCLREMGDQTNALKSLLRAVELAPDNPEYLFNLGEVLETIGIMYMSNKYLDSAIQTFRMVVNQMPNNASAWNHMGICFKEMGKAEESRFYFDRSRDIVLWKKDTPIRRKRDDYV